MRTTSATFPAFSDPVPAFWAGSANRYAANTSFPSIAGEKRAAFAFTEPDDADRATWGVLDGDTLTVNGQKSYVTGGASADFVNVLVEIDEHGPAMVVIDREAPGVHVRRTFGSVDGSHHAYMEFRDVRLPASHIVGEPGRGLPRAMRQIGDTRLALAAESVGLCRWVIDFVTEHISSPHRSGAPLGTREGVRLRYADMRIRAYAARSMVYRTARLGDAGGEHHQRGHRREGVRDGDRLGTSSTPGSSWLAAARCGAAIPWRRCIAV